MNGNNGNGKPKLEFQINIPTQLKLMQDKPATGESQYGKWFLYSVFADNQEQSLFAPEQVQKFIEANELKKGDEISVTKILAKNGKKNTIDFNIELLNKFPVQIERPATNGNGKPDDVKIMKECLQAALDLQQELGIVFDVNRIGLSLYISRTKNGYGYQF
jgi:hypothetical protein